MKSFLLGICASLLASAILYVIAVFISRQHIRHLEGYWFQTIPGLAKSPYSIGQFTYNKFSRTFSWDGTNYTVTGEPIANWQSFHLHYDPTNRRILYIFGGKTKDPPSKFDGFGVMDLRYKDGKDLIPIGGYFQDARKVASPQDFELKRLEDVADMLGVVQGRRSLEHYHRDILQRYHEQHKDNEPGV
jgi:hypothetical protein